MKKFYQSTVYFTCKCPLIDQFMVVTADVSKKLNRFKPGKKLGTCDGCRSEKTCTAVYGPRTIVQPEEAQE
jgi:hypothetical protein